MQWVNTILKYSDDQKFEWFNVDVLKLANVVSKADLTGVYSDFSPHASWA